MLLFGQRFCLCKRNAPNNWSEKSPPGAHFFPKAKLFIQIYEFNSKKVLGTNSKKNETNLKMESLD